MNEIPKKITNSKKTNKQKTRKKERKETCVHAAALL